MLFRSLYMTEKVAAYTVSIDDLVNTEQAETEELQQMLSDDSPDENKKNLH
mgnify:FL=1